MIKTNFTRKKLPTRIITFVLIALCFASCSSTRMALQSSKEMDFVQAKTDFPKSQNFAPVPEINLPVEEIAINSSNQGINRIPEGTFQTKSIEISKSITQPTFAATFKAVKINKGMEKIASIMHKNTVAASSHSIKEHAYHLLVSGLLCLLVAAVFYAVGLWILGWIFGVIGIVLLICWLLRIIMSV
jgi:hypothetical protein